MTILIFHMMERGMEVVPVWAVIVMKNDMAAREEEMGMD